MEQTGWILIPPYILEREDLSKTDKLLFGRILGLANQRGYCFATNEYLGKTLFVSPITVSHSISVLVEKGFLIRKLIRSKENPFMVTERQLFIGKSADVENDITGDAENDNTLSQNRLVEYKSTEYITDPQEDETPSADKKLRFSDLLNLPEDFVLKMALKHRLFKNVVIEEAKKAHQWAVDKKAEKKYSAWEMFLNNWFRRTSQKVNPETYNPGISDINLEDGSLVREVKEDGTNTVYSSYAWDQECIKRGIMKPEHTVEALREQLLAKKEAGTITKIELLDLDDWEQSVEIRKKIHAKWLKGDYAGY